MSQKLGSIMFGIKFRRIALGAAAATAILSVLPVTATAAPPSWRMVDLGAGDGSVAWAINDRGHVVGTRGDGEAFLWRHGRTTDLGAFTPTDVNNREEVVGYRFDETGTRAVLWRKGVRTDLATSPGGQTLAAAVNDRTEIVGWSTAGADSPMRASSWRHGVRTPIGGDHSQAADINNRGQVVGSAGSLNAVAVRWWRGKETRLSTDPSQAMAVNRSGTVTGLHFGPSTDGFVWQRGRFVVLPAPAGEPLFSFLQPAGINGRTQIVGSSSDGAFVRERGRTTILPALTRASSANDINEHGVIAGSNPTTTEGLRPHAVLWLR